MEYIPWVLAAIFAVFALFELSAAKSSYRKLNDLNEYVQYLLFHPQVYGDHREKFLSYVAQLGEADVTQRAMASSRAVEYMAIGLADKILLPNILSRSGVHPDDPTSGNDA